MQYWTLHLAVQHYVVSLDNKTIRNRSEDCCSLVFISQAVAEEKRHEFNTMFPDMYITTTFNGTLPSMTWVSRYQKNIPHLHTVSVAIMQLI